MSRARNFGEVLTPREVEVMKVSADGWTAVAVGHKLGISPKVVHFHKLNVYRKLGVNSMIEAVKALGWLVVPE